MTQLWRTTLDVLDADGIPVQQRAFLSLAKLVGLLDDTALIAVPNDFTKDVVETRLRDRVTATLGSQLGREVRLAVTVDPSLAEAPPLDLRDEGHDRTIPESSIIIEYLHAHYPGRTKLLPDDADGALQARLWDRFYDLYVNVPMQAIVADRRRPADRKDPLGVEQARARLQTAYGII